MTTADRGGPQPDGTNGAPVALLLCADLMFAVQLQSMARAAGYRSVAVRPGGQLPPGDVLIVNLAEQGPWRALIEQAASRGTPVVAFGPHVDAESRKEAKALGAKRVLVNSNLARDLPLILKDLAQSVKREARSETTDH